MTENSYKTPEADLTPADWELRRQRFKAWAKDRAAFWAIASLGWAGLLIIASMISMRWVGIVFATVVAIMILWELAAWGWRSVRK